MRSMLPAVHFAVYALCSGLSLILLKSGLATFEFNVAAIIRNWKLLVGFAGYLVGFVMWMFILSRYRLNTAFPVAMSLFFVVSGLGSYFLLKEPLSGLQGLGIVVCLIGIMLVAVK